jgi:hypothetical protein
MGQRSSLGKLVLDVEGGVRRGSLNLAALRYSEGVP